ncbi:Uncharacterised protein [Yersinia aldovae]|uniref:Uncharacterized protein n=1 Tax=Yersinia aldovae TaxID=29483 RepID=A0ABP1YR12_YERAL|nr:hypothetical protein AT01_317 [Yersinia aldovae 670-83]CNK76578.1 Uncharacterised protein [Yersinia aldovae]
MSLIFWLMSYIPLDFNLQAGAIWKMTGIFYGLTLGRTNEKYTFDSVSRCFWPCWQ